MHLTKDSSQFKFLQKHASPTYPAETSVSQSCHDKKNKRLVSVIFQAKTSNTVFAGRSFFSVRICVGLLAGQKKLFDNVTLDSVGNCFDI